MAIKRWDLINHGSYHEEAEDGFWVSHDDHLTALRSQLEGIAKMVGDMIRVQPYVVAIVDAILSYQPDEGKEESHGEG